MRGWGCEGWGWGCEGGGVRDRGGGGVRLCDCWSVTADVVGCIEAALEKDIPRTRKQVQCPRDQARTHARTLTQHAHPTYHYTIIAEKVGHGINSLHIHVVFLHSSTFLPARLTCRLVVDAAQVMA